MKLFQMAVFTAVLFGNIHFGWIRNGYAATLGAAIVTWYATFILWRLQTASLSRKQRSNQPGRQRTLHWIRREIAGS